LRQCKPFDVYDFEFLLYTFDFFMRNDLSIVIVCKNEKGNIERVLDSLQGISDDIFIYDNGSTDGTLDLLNNYPVRVHQGPWLGYGQTKHQSVLLAKHDWILHLDADEAIDTQLKKKLLALPLNNTNEVYSLAYKNFLGHKHLKWGEWGTDWHVRLFNRQVVNWDDASVHEQLVLPHHMVIKKLKGFVLHITMKDTAEYAAKMVHYALLNADKQFKKGKRATPIKRFISPVFNFIKNYIFRLGFLDGWEGLLSARMTAFYTTLKYARLYELWKEGKR
jgi:glycosyltransferase involved in cell wall biosynthesis